MLPEIHPIPDSGTAHSTPLERTSICGNIAQVELTRRPMDHDTAALSERSGSDELERYIQEMAQALGAQAIVNADNDLLARFLHDIAEIKEPEKRNINKSLFGDIALGLNMIHFAWTFGERLCQTRNCLHVVRVASRPSIGFSICAAKRSRPSRNCLRRPPGMMILGVRKSWSVLARLAAP